MKERARSLIAAMIALALLGSLASCSTLLKKKGLPPGVEKKITGEKDASRAAKTR